MSRHHPRTVLVTGASSGIGYACALYLASLGHTVYGTSRHPKSELPSTLLSAIESLKSLHFIVVDVNDPESIDCAVDKIVEHAGRLDVIVNCAGFGIGGSIEETSDDEIRALLETNVLGTLRVIRAALPIMRKQQNGLIINLSSIGGVIGLPFQGGYSATKFAIEGLTEALRMEVRRFGIRAVLIEPGDFRTGFTDRRKCTVASESSDTYRTAQQHVLSIVEKDERGGKSPEAIARLVARILRKRSPRVRYTIGPVAQRIAAGLKRILPSTVFEWILSMYYGVRA